MIRERPLSARPTALVPLALAWVLVLAVDARAYLDPGTGSYVFQMVIAVILSGAFTIKHFWHRIKARVFQRGQRGQREHREPGKATADPSASPANDNPSVP